MREVQYRDILGVQVPFMASTAVTAIGPDGSIVVRQIPPQYINNLERWEKTKSTWALSAALISMQREALLDIVRGSAFRARGFEAPIAVSKGIPKGFCYVDYRGGRIILNEEQAATKYIDADGDRAIVIFSADKKRVVLIKFPITSHPMILHVLAEEEYPREPLQKLTKRILSRLLAENPIVELTEELQYELFLKKNSEAPVGLWTSIWNNFDLYESQGMAWEERMEYIFNSFLQEDEKPLRAITIEDNTMKVSRKDGFKGANEESDIERQVRLFGAAKALDHQHAWLLTSCSSIGGMQPYQLDWLNGLNLERGDLDRVVANAMGLKVSFRALQPSKEQTKQFTFHEGGLLQRLKELNLIGWNEIPHADPNMPPSVAFWLQLPNGSPCALTDVKREGRNEGLTYLFLMSPVWDNLDLWNADGTAIVFPAKKAWVHPIDHLQKVCCTLDMSIRPYTGGPIVSYFPQDLHDWVKPERAIKVSILQGFLTDYCSRYGDPCPATKTPQGIQPSPIATGIISRTMIIDYGADLTAEEMYPIAQAAHKKCNFVFSGSKGESRRLRKVCLAGDHGRTCLDPKGKSHPNRGAINRSQLQRAVSRKTYKVAVIQNHDGHGVLITNAGIAKQATTKAFLPQVFNTYDEYLQHVATHHLSDADMDPADVPRVADKVLPVEEVTYFSWTGEIRRCWCVGAQSTIQIGKLVDVYGNKFMPRWYADATCTTKKGEEEIDLIFPVEEFIAKGNLHSIMEGAIEGTLKIPALKEEIPCMYIEMPLFRTGAASENIPARWRTAAFKGMDAYPIQWTIKKIRPHTPSRERLMPDLAFAKDLLEARRALLGELAEEPISEYEQYYD